MQAIRVTRPAAKPTIVALFLAVALVLVFVCLVGVASAIAPQAELLAPDGGANDVLGGSVAVSGDTAVVGAREATVDGMVRRGAAYVFVRNGAAWDFQGKLIAPDGAQDDRFGCAVAVYRDTAVVGAMQDDSNTGAAYVYTRANGAWTFARKLKAADAAADARFGDAVAISGGTIVVGADGDRGSTYNEGAAYVFTGDGRVWSQQAKLRARDSGQGDMFGRVVAMSGETVVLGAPNHSIGANTGQGAAYVFTRAGTTWSQQEKLTNPAGKVWDKYGSSVAISGDTVLVGTGDEAISNGAVYVHVRSGTSWTLQKRLAPPTAESRFGCSVGLAGDTAVVGANYYSLGGAAYIFMRSGASWTRRATLLRPAPRAGGDWFGCSVGISGGTVVVGAQNAAIGATSFQGAAYVWADIVKPRIRSLRPTRGRVGATVTIAGRGFQARRGTSKVYFGSKVVKRYVSWSTTKIRVKVPSIGIGKTKVRVRTVFGRSNAVVFRRR